MPTRLSLRKVYRQSIDLIGRNALAILLLVIVVGWLPRLGIAQLHIHALVPGQWSVVGWFTDLLLAGLRMFLGQVLLVGVMHTVLTNSSSLSRSLGDTARAVSRRLLPLAPLTLILDGPALIPTIAKIQYALLFGGPDRVHNLPGFIVLWSAIGYVAGVWVILWVGVAGAVFIEESLPVGRSLARAARLLSRQRWRFFIVWLPYAIFELLLITALTLPPILFHASIMAVAERQFALTSLVMSLAAALWATLIAVSYRELRRMKDGSTVEIADVFD